jgi:hypothetical protein
MNVARAEIVAILRSRGLQARADWVDRNLPTIVDTHKNGALLRMLDIDPSTMSPVDVSPPQG